MRKELKMKKKGSKRVGGEESRQCGEELGLEERAAGGPLAIQKDNC